MKSICSLDCGLNKMTSSLLLRNVNWICEVG